MLIVDTKNAPGAIGPYSQAYETNGLVVTSGQLPVNPADATMPAGIAASKPARSCVAVKDLPKGALCEIEAIAVK